MVMMLMERRRCTPETSKREICVRVSTLGWGDQEEAVDPGASTLCRHRERGYSLRSRRSQSNEDLTQYRILQGRPVTRQGDKHSDRNVLRDTTLGLGGSRLRTLIPIRIDWN